MNVRDWTKRMLYYQDGRFAKDRIWCFSALSFATRKKNQLSGGFFVDGFFKEGPKSLEELQAEIAGGNTQWLERLCYYSQQVAGSPGSGKPKERKGILRSTIILKLVMDLQHSSLHYLVQNTCGLIKKD